MNIIDLVKLQRQEQPVNDKPNVKDFDERAQIVVAMDGQGNCIFRYRSVKAAQKEFNALMKAYAAYDMGKSKGLSPTHTVKSEQLTTALVLHKIICMTISETEKYIAFRPYGYGQQ